jgi:membrane protein YqaA with SNARE-associated domain
MMTDTGLWALCVSAFISATIAPGGSEAVLAYLVNQGHYSVSLLLGLATMANSLGAMTTWWLGGLMVKKIPLATNLSADKQRALATVRKWGHYVLFFSWLPVVGDGFCFAAGWLRLPWLPGLLAIALGKLARYAAIAYWVG